MQWSPINTITMDHKNLTVLMGWWPQQCGRAKFHDWAILSDVLTDITIAVLNKTVFFNKHSKCRYNMFFFKC